MAEDSPAVRKNDSLPTDTPGIGVAGTVMCPFGFQKSPCLKGGCELWVELKYGQHKVARCSYAWQAVLGTEIRQEIRNLKEGLCGENSDEKR